MVYDIAIIGAGVVGTLTARTLAKYNLKTVLIEKTSDIAMGTSKANSGIVHAGFDAKSGTLKAKLNVQGCGMMEEVCSTLFVPYEKNGSLVVAFSEGEMEHIKTLYERGIKNGVPDMEIIDQAKLRELEPHISETAVGALWAKSAGIVSPYELAIAAAECAVSNGVDFVRNFEVADIKYADDIFTLTCKGGKEIRPSWLLTLPVCMLTRLQNSLTEKNLTSFRVWVNTDFWTEVLLTFAPIPFSSARTKWVRAFWLLQPRITTFW